MTTSEPVEPAEPVLGPGDVYVHDEPAFAIIRDQLRPGDTVLDIGCGFGNVGRFLSASGATVDGIEPDPERAAQARSVLRTVVPTGLADALDDPALAGAYSVVTILDVVEHFADPVGALRSAAGLVAPGGRMFLFVPNSAHWSFRKKMLRGNWTYTDWGLFDRTHLRFFDLDTAAQLVADAGLVETRRWCTKPLPTRVSSVLVDRMPSLFALHVLFELRVP